MSSSRVCRWCLSPVGGGGGDIINKREVGNKQAGLVVRVRKQEIVFEAPMFNSFSVITDRPTRSL